jgi:hypothetical protein
MKEELSGTAGTAVDCVSANQIPIFAAKAKLPMTRMASNERAF